MFDGGRERGARNLLARDTQGHPARFSSVSPLRLRNVPLLAVALSFAAGVLCRPWWQPPAQAVCMCVLLLTVSALAWWKAPRMVWACVCLSWIALGWTAAMLQPSQEDRSLLAYADELQRTVDARVLAVRMLPPRSSAVETSDKDDLRAEEDSDFAMGSAVGPRSQSIDLAVNAVEEITPETSRMVPTHGGVRVTLISRPGKAEAAIPCGAHITVTLRMREPQRYLDPGVWQYADSLATQGISVQSSADASTVRVFDTSNKPLSCRFTTAQQWATECLGKLSSTTAALPHWMQLTRQDTAILTAMLVGDRTLLGRGLRASFERTGSFHLFVVAGVHVAFLMAAVYWMLLKLRAPRWIAAAVSLSVTAAYAVFTGFGAPVQRALLMSGVFLLTQLIGRRRNSLNSLGAAALAMLLLRPAALTEAGFQMTMLAVIAIAGLAQPLAQRTFASYGRALRDIDFLRIDPTFPPRLAQFRMSVRWMGQRLAAGGHRQALRRSSGHASALYQLPAWIMRCLIWIVDLALLTLVAEAVLALPMAIYFHRATPFAAPANMLALPLVGVLMVSGVITFGASLLHPWLAVAPVACTAMLLHAVNAIIGGLSSLRGADIRTPAPLLVMSLTALVLWMAALWMLREQSRRSGWLGAALLPAALLLVLLPRRPRIERNTLEFTAIDVGQGDSLFVVSPSGGTMLIDAGGPTGSATAVQENNFDIGEQVVSPYLWSRGLRRLDTVVLTHAHSDHITGMAAVMRNFRPRELWLSVDADTPAFHALLREAADLHITVRRLRAGDALKWHDAAIRVLSPAASYVPYKLPANDDSLALRIDYGRASVLAEGDAEHPSEKLIESEQPGTVSLLKVGHHGSNTSTSESLLRAIQPRAAVISCGRGNRFGHPRMPVLQRLQGAGVQTARTDTMGAVEYHLHPDGEMEVHIPSAQ